ncbi:Sulfur transfer protein involved in thiamine biosynthesis ThiS [Methanonatronarchaeum thermophilum]|uniref:Sulfur transfer protein involved in thiamine biosynthesis ThiS n=1 Tax=Methanonatronarchaeum thermophilum TaxID=1927129 RepID=A0A1Y3GBZ9_9EURY|nr:MoaD/ThiS family protein [Methanonatronarchaeum thermophilum]OUJ18992.1 Sulfur transfer protein involved in thiamine biosynthesis ThiS [Methanonatronarchaeum thermophilum]
MIVEIEDEEVEVEVSEGAKISSLVEQLELDAESMVFTKNDRFVPIDEEIGGSRRIGVHKVVSGG